ncbi:MAG: ABC transporter permease [Anaerolineae bacterium]
MRNVWNIAINQIRVQLAERGMILQQFIVPIIMMIGIGSFISGANFVTERIDVLHSGDALAQQYVQMLRAEGEKQVQGVALFVVCDLTLTAADNPEACQLGDLTPNNAAELAKQRIESNTTIAAITIPADFTTKLTANQRAEIGLMTRSNDPQNSQRVSGFLQAVDSRLSGTLVGAQVVTQVTKGDAAFYQKVFDGANALWETDPIQVTITWTTVTGTATGSGFGQSAPGIGSMFVMINALVLLQVFITERQRWTLQRLQMMPVSRAGILAGKLLGQYLMGLITFAIMIVAGALLGVKWGDPLGVLAVVLIFTLCVTALGLMLSTFFKTVGQAAGMTTLIPMILAPLGGAWWSLDLMPQAMQTVGRIISPIAWSQEAFSKMIFYGDGLVDILPQLGVLLIFTAVYFAIGVLRFRLD